MKRALIFTGLAIASLGSFWLIFDRSIAVALIIMGSIAWHEVGHMIAYKYLGINSEFYFLPFLGGFAKATVPHTELTDAKASWVAIMGPATTFLLAVLAYGGYYLTGETLYLVAANLNAGLGFFNLLPIGFKQGGLDGGIIAHRIFSSLKEVDEPKFMLVTLIVGLALATYMIIANKLTFVVLLMAYGMRSRSNSDDPAHAYLPTAMSNKTVTYLAGIYFFMMIASFVIQEITPLWNTLV
ncbi:M50 family metallopeptidase [bacterium]|nr:M50 family metallopeptidase [bacterium]PIP56110.1 MAG: hypothetical protein COX05_04795 [candidate division WWE3 bacterium CG22_combo_CG10-13_8_21_14_all_39_12]